MDRNEGRKEFEKEEEEYVSNHMARKNEVPGVDSETEPNSDYSYTIKDTPVVSVKKEAIGISDKTKSGTGGSGAAREKNEGEEKNGEITLLPQDVSPKIEFSVPETNQEGVIAVDSSEKKEEKKEDADVKQTVVVQPVKEEDDDALVKLVGSKYAKSGDENGLQKGKSLIIETVKHSHPHHRSEADEVMHDTDLRFRSKKIVDNDAIKAGAALSVVIILVVFLIFSGNNPPESEMEKSETNETSGEPAAFLSVPVMYSFEKYINPEDSNYNKDVSLMCFLREETRKGSGTVQFIDYYAVDDYGNKIKLNFFRLRNPNIYEGLFMINSTTKELFNVSGSLRKEGYQELKLYVSNITPAEREYERRKAE